MLIHAIKLTKLRRRIAACFAEAIERCYWPQWLGKVEFIGIDRLAAEYA